MKNNWDLTMFSQTVETQNFYGERRAMAQILLTQGGFVGTLGIWWCPTEYRDKIAQKVLRTLATEGMEVVVSYPLPDLDNMPLPMFDAYSLVKSSP